MKVLLFASLTFILFACSPTKVAQINSDKLTAGPNGYVFENDTVKITYRFWDNKGRMEYDIFNKLDQPIYVDWKTSAYIPNDKMVSYYRDETNAEIVSSSYYVFGRYSSSTSSSAKSKATHQERVAVIPPQSMITQKDYSLLKSYSDIPVSGTFTSTNSPLRFRNYISVSTSEDFKGKISYINNSFYLASVRKVSTDKVQKYKTESGFFAAQKYAEAYH